MKSNRLLLWVYTLSLVLVSIYVADVFSLPCLWPILFSIFYLCVFHGIWNKLSTFLFLFFAGKDTVFSLILHFVRGQKVQPLKMLSQYFRGEAVSFIDEEKLDKSLLKAARLSSILLLPIPVFLLGGVYTASIFIKGDFSFLLTFSWTLVFWGMGVVVLTWMA